MFKSIMSKSANFISVHLHLVFAVVLGLIAVSDYWYGNTQIGVFRTIVAAVFLAWWIVRHDKIKYALVSAIIMTILSLADATMIVVCIMDETYFYIIFYALLLIFTSLAAVFTFGKYKDLVRKRKEFRNQNSSSIAE